MLAQPVLIYTVNGKKSRFIFFIGSTNASQFKRKF